MPLRGGAGNLLVDETLRVRVADFGLARVMHDLTTLTGGCLAASLPWLEAQTCGGRLELCPSLTASKCVCMNVWLTSTQPPGLMKHEGVDHQEFFPHKGTKRIRHATGFRGVCKGWP